ncbi:Ig-like domain-containing protein [Xanthocytophaga flava]|uniref:Ig-like domain-containing protein n=1 Tax=Xanthocytophaga flava TaxID=3048013 RepID=UPI0028D5C7A1|nr:Ig-like domain-containing protein [Xanthocytophaga flavus]MDJ1470811.1 Ig-like domain-containing protein [Xanthocytophaga flavus]
MKSSLRHLGALTGSLVLLFLLGGCTTPEDIIPGSSNNFELYEDDVYAFGGGGIIRMDPLGNDSLKTAVTVTFGQPRHGTLSIEPDGDTYYKPENGFFGTDSLTYEACSESTCKTQKIRLHIEVPLDPNNCTNVVVADSLQTTRNTPKGIRIFENDIICPMAGRSVYAPQLGTFRTIEYAGSYKNTIYVYQPPKDFTGEDSFRYRVYPDQNYNTYLEVIVKVKVN